MSEQLPGATLRTNALLRRLIPVICAGVIINLAFSWYSSDQAPSPDWSKFSFFYLFLAASLALLPWFWHCVRLAIWGRFFGVKISKGNLLRIVVATDVGAAIAPQAVGGAPVKMTMLIQQGYTPGKAAMLALLSNVEDVIFFTVAIPVSTALIRPWQNPLWQQAGLWIGRHGWKTLPLLLLFGALFWGWKRFFQPGFYPGHRFFARWQHWIADFKASVALIYRTGRKPFLLSILALSAQWLTRFSILVSVLLALGMPQHLWHFFLLQWMVFVAMVLTPTPGATGGAEAAFLLVFGEIIPKSAVGAVLAGWRFLTYYFVLLTGVSLLWLLRERIQPDSKKVA